MQLLFPYLKAFYVVEVLHPDALCLINYTTAIVLTGRLRIVFKLCLCTNLLTRADLIDLRVSRHFWLGTVVALLDFL